MKKLCYEYGPAISNRKTRVAKFIILVYVAGIKVIVQLLKIHGS